MFFCPESKTERDRAHKKSPKHLKDLIFIELGGQFGGDHEKINKPPTAAIAFLSSKSATERDRAHKKSSKHLKDLTFIELGGQFGGNHEKLTKHLLFLSFFCAQIPRPAATVRTKNRQNTSRI